MPGGACAQAGLGGLVQTAYGDGRHESMIALLSLTRTPSAAPFKCRPRTTFAGRSSNLCYVSFRKRPAHGRPADAENTGRGLFRLALRQQFVQALGVQHPLTQIFKLGRRHFRQFFSGPTREGAEALLDLPFYGFRQVPQSSQDHQLR